MTSLVLALIALLALACLVFLVWRLASRRHALPCPPWLGWMVEMDNPFTRVNRAAEIIALLDVRAGMKVLDAGCGPGRLAIPLAQAVGAEGMVTALDLQAAMLARLQVKAEAAGLAERIDLLQAGLGEGRLPKDTFDRALLVTVLGEIPDREKALAELFGALRPGGLLSVTEIVFDPHFQTRRSLRRLAQAAGFREKAAFGNAIAYTLHLERPAEG